MGRRGWLIVIALILFIAGAGVIAYPHLQEQTYENHVAALKEQVLRDLKPPHALNTPGSSDATDITDITDVTGAINAANRYDLLYAYLESENKRLFETGQEDLTDAFSYEQPAMDLSVYGIKDNCIGFIAIPCLGMELPIYLGANTQNMKKGAVHLTNTSYPIGGENTISVIAAHRGSSLAMFRNIHKIKIGDEVIITNFWEELRYRAVEIAIIVPSDIERIRIQPGRDLVTLISCEPLGKTYQRYVVYCERIS